MKTPALALRALSILLLVSFVPALHAQGKGGRLAAKPAAVEASALTAMPVRELAIFKDGHAFVMHECELPTDADGNIVIDTLPTPVLGTFWPYSADANARLAAVVAGTRDVKSEHKALSVRALLEANLGANVVITEVDGDPYDATVIDIPTRPKKDAGQNVSNIEQQARCAPPYEPGNVALLRVNGGVKAIPLSRIRDVVFCDEPNTAVETIDARKLLTLKLDWGEQQPGASANVGMVYLQRGVRWIPNYRIDIDEAGKAHVRLQATLINELADIDGATAHLVIGVPSFRFRDTLDPMSLQEAAVQLSQHFQQQREGMYNAFSNAMMTQVAQGYDYNPSAADAGAAGSTDPAIASASRHEDMFVFDVKNVTLRKGERMVVPVVEFTLPYEDVFALDVPFTPPAEARCNANDAQLAELFRLLQAPKAMHRIRLHNTSAYPLTTAPVIILADGQLLAQSMMTYASCGAMCDVDLTTAIEIQVSKSDAETNRTPSAEQWGGHTYGRIDLAGKIALMNHGGKPITLEVRRYVLGQADTADNDGTIVQTSVFDDDHAQPGGTYPYWWRWYYWPDWWFHFNGVGRVSWEVRLEAGHGAELNYAWHYFWR